MFYDAQFESVVLEIGKSDITIIRTTLYFKLKRLAINVIKDMPQRNHIPALAELVYKPVSCLIKQEALKVSNNCVTKFHLDEED